MRNKKIYIAWIKFQRRAVSMERFFGYKTVHITSVFKRKQFRLLDYIIKSIKTISCLLKHRPEEVWLQLPPSFLLDILLLYKKLYNKNLIIITDCHNGVFFGKWKSLFNPKRLNRSDFIIVHNEVIKEVSVEIGLENKKTIILEDRPAVQPLNPIANDLKKYKHQVLMPCGFSDDEPLNVVFEAAKKIPDITILISGPKERGASLFDYSLQPKNVILTGYLSLSEYESLFMQSDLILGLTTEDHIQLSVANEATGLEKPMILSNTVLLQKMFNKGVIYVDTLNPESIADGIKSGFDQLDLLSKNVKLLKQERLLKWETMATNIKKEIQKSLFIKHRKP